MSVEHDDKSRVVRTLNSLLRSEISAAESYSQTIPRVGRHVSDVAVLRAIAKEHGTAVKTIRSEIERHGGKPEETSGVWPALTKTVDGPASVFGDAVALQALKDGEERGLEDYREALQRMNDATGDFIARSLIPAQEKHIRRLDEILAKL